MLIELRKVSGGYGPVNVLDQLDLGVAEGEVGVILGANGAGKTTTLRAICGMLDDVRGEVFFDDSEITGKSTQAIARAGIAHVPQGRGTFGDLSVDDNLRLGAITRNDDGIDSDLARWYEAFAQWKTGVVIQQLHRRWERGESSDPRMETIADRLPTLASSASRLLDELN